MEQTRYQIKRIEQAITALVEKRLLERVEPVIYNCNIDIFGRLPWKNIDNIELAINFEENTLKGNIKYKYCGFNRIAIEHPNTNEAVFKGLLKYISSDNESARLALRNTIKSFKPVYYIVSEQDEEVFLKNYHDDSKIVEKYKIISIEEPQIINLYNYSDDCPEGEDFDTLVSYTYCIDETGLCFRGYEIGGKDKGYKVVDLEFNDTREMKEDMKNPTLSETWEIRDCLR